MNYQNLVIESDNGVATLTVNRPRAFNALSSEVLKELAAAIGGLEADPAVKAVVVTGAGELLPKARETAAAIAGVSTLGVACAKDAIVNGLNMTKEDGFRYEASLFGLLFATADQKEGMGAFVAKRQAVFTGK